MTEQTAAGTQQAALSVNNLVTLTGEAAGLGQHL